MRLAITLVVALAVLVFHYWASHRPPRYWYVGGIISLAWLVLLAAAFSHGMVNWPQDWKIIVFPTLIFFFMWAEGHEAARKKELAKMKAQDME